jgi:energy-coupling factor transporter transmembrane protein EcfT
MVTYLYWGFLFALVVAVIVGIGLKMGSLKSALVVAAIIVFVGWAAYYFWLQQIFVKRWGGVMSISIPSGQYHIATTWKDDNLWVENYDPETNRCVFSEYSKGNLLEGRVTIKNCNPIMFLVGTGVQGSPAADGMHGTHDEFAPQAESSANKPAHME